MSSKIKAIRGFNDLLPEQLRYWHFVEETLRQVMPAYGYNEIRLPIVEKTELFKRSIGEVTDIVAKEMYTFDDRNGDSLTLRPEGTAGCVRAAIEHSQLRGQTPRWWYLAPMFRHERPQKGRYRQFYQLGVEAFGMPGPNIDAELICLSYNFFQRLGLEEQVSLEINTLGSLDSRQAYQAALKKYFSEHKAELDEDSLQRLHKNPMRILDSKNPDMQTLINNAPTLMEHIDHQSKQHFELLCSLLAASGIGFKHNPRLVRGLDYYSNTVFEWVTDQLGSQNAVCAGGRYDDLVTQLGGEPCPAIGFACGIERLVALLEQQPDFQFEDNIKHAYLVMAGEGTQQHGFLLAKTLREALPDLHLMMHCGGGNFKNQLKKADKSGAYLALILGEDEVEKGEVAIKFLRENKPQMKLSLSDIVDFIAAALV